MAVLTDLTSKNSVLQALTDNYRAMINAYGASEAYDIFQQVTKGGMTTSQAIEAMEKAGIKIYRVNNGDIITFDSNIIVPTENISNNTILNPNANDTLKIGKAIDSTKTNNVTGMNGSTANSTISSYGTGSKVKVAVNGYSSSKVIDGVYESQPAKMGVSRKFVNGVEVLDKPKVTLSSNISSALSMAGSLVNAGVTIGSAFYTAANLIGVDKVKEYLPEEANKFFFGDDTVPTIIEVVYNQGPEASYHYFNYILEDNFVYNIKYGFDKGFFNAESGIYVDFSNASIPNIWGDKLYVTTGTKVTATAYYGTGHDERIIETDETCIIYTFKFSYSAPFKQFNYGSMVANGSFFNAISTINGVVSNLNVYSITYKQHTAYYTVDRGWDFTGLIKFTDISEVGSSAPIKELTSPIGSPPDDFTNNATGNRTADIWAYVAWLLIFGKYGGGQGFEGLNIIGDTPTWIEHDDTLNDIKSKYREKYKGLYDNRIEVDVVQDDGSEKTYIYIQAPLPNGGEGEKPTTEGLTQDEDDRKIKPNDPTTPKVTLDTLLEQISGVKPNPNPEPSGDYRGMAPPNTPLPNPTTPEPPPTGEGDTPSVIIPVGTATALWSIYNPTLEQVKSLGSWLWSSNFADQILKVLADPMQAIISCHKVFGTPVTDGTANIKVGYLDSGVSDVNIVSNQYTHIDCGYVNMYEYFGNVFDYAPYTDIQIYLPFIGIVPLRVEDVLRSTISVSYDIDVLTGTCLANINVLRDNAGGVLYTYNGNCAVQYPLSSGSYLGLSSALLGLVGGAVTGGIAGAVVGGVMTAINGKGTDIKRSGNLSGNAGAMGIKKPYVIISRPITAMANNYQKYLGIPTNSTAKLSDCKGFVKCKEVFINSGTFTANLKQNITNEQANEIESLLKQGVIIN